MLRKIQLKTVSWHLIFWACLFLYEWLPASSIHDCYQVAFNAAILNVPIIMAATYFNIFVTFERFLLKKRYALFGLTLGLSFLVFGFLRRVVNFYFVFSVLYPQKAVNLFFFPKVIMDTVNVHLFVALGAMVYFIQKWTEQRRINEELMKEKVAAELSLLKSQVQPHFIFNTLNNIYMLSLKSSPQTSEMIYRLSALLSYMLYDSKRQFIEVEKEIDYVKNYINLEKIRYGERLDVQLTVINNVKGVTVPPLLFLPLVENAFKHGVSNAVEDSWIHIDISLKKKILVFKIENSVIKEKGLSNGFGNGLGLENLKRRLEILYPNRHDLKVMEDECSYLATVKLNFDNNTEGVDLIPDKKRKLKEKAEIAGTTAFTFSNLLLFLKP
ncbi:MAG: histidine kinase [Saprospiraceae bacterium]|nr:histidine kinase [Saprospiraceae bacterium]